MKVGLKIAALVGVLLMGSTTSYADSSVYATLLSAAYQAVPGLGEKASRADQGILDAPTTISNKYIVSISPNWQNKPPFQDQSDKYGKTITRPPTVTYERDGTLVPEEIYAQLSQARALLISALARGVRHSHGGKAAAAQAQFDCWANSQSASCQREAQALIQDLFQKVKNNPYYVKTASSKPGISCKDDPRGRRHSFGGYTNLTDDIAEALDRARIETESGIACIETSR